MSVSFENILREEIRTAVREYFGTLSDLKTGPVLQLHAAATKSGLSRAVRKTKRSQLADMKKNVEYFFAAPKGVSVPVWTDRWATSIHQMQKKTGFRWSAHRDRDHGGAVIVRTA